MEEKLQQNDVKTEIQLDPAIQNVNKKLMRLSIDERVNTKRNSIIFDDSAPVPSKTEVFFKDSQDETTVGKIKVKKLLSGESRFPRIEEMSHFHYNTIDFEDKLEISVSEDQGNDGNVDTDNTLITVCCSDKSWLIKRSYQDLIGLDRQLHRCIYDRFYSKLEQLQEKEKIDKDQTDEEMKEKIAAYLERLNDIAGNNLNCGPILNWLELDNHGNHLVVMEADDSAINVPAIAAAHVIKRYIAQAPDEITLEVGEFVSVIDMPPSEETIWWRGKKGFEVGFFPSSCVDVLIDKDLDSQLIQHGMKQRPVNKRRGKFISFLRYFFRSRPSKDELMQSGILRERTFGCDLGEHLACTGREIPLVLEMCSSVIEEHGIVDGIYRLSGITSNMQKLRLAFDNEEPPNLTESRYLHDIHCISSLLKTYFRELPNPLLTYELYDKFLAALRKTDDTERTVAFHHAIQRLPPPHYRTLEFLLRHLEKCASFSNVTSMNEKNLAIVWAPNLLKPNAKEPCGAALLDIRNQAIIIEYLLKNVAIFFDKNLASAAIAFYPETDNAEVNAPENGQLKNFVLDKSHVDKIGSGPPKLISLTEARARMKENNKVAEENAKNEAGDMPRRKSRPPSNPTIPASIPISPGPSLLSLEEAQARSKVKNSKLLRRSSLDVIQSQPRLNKNGFLETTSKKRSWKGLFSRNKSVSDELDSYGDSKKSQTLSFKRRISYDIAEMPDMSTTRSQSSYNIRELDTNEVPERLPQGKKGRKKKQLEISSPLGVRTSSFVSYVGGMRQLERTRTAPAVDLREAAKAAQSRSLDKAKSLDVGLRESDKNCEVTKRNDDTDDIVRLGEITDSKDAVDNHPGLKMKNDVTNEDANSDKSNDNSLEICSKDLDSGSPSPVDRKDIRNSVWIQKYDDIARTCLENMNVTEKENSPVKQLDVVPSDDSSDNKESTKSPRRRTPEEIRYSFFRRGSRELQVNTSLPKHGATSSAIIETRSSSVELCRSTRTDSLKRASTLSEGCEPRIDAANGLALDWVPVMQHSLSSDLRTLDKIPGKFPLDLKEHAEKQQLSQKGSVAKREWMNRPFSSYDNHPTPQTGEFDRVSKHITKHRPSIYDNLL